MIAWLNAGMWLVKLYLVDKLVSHLLSGLSLRDTEYQRHCVTVAGTFVILRAGAFGDLRLLSS